MIQKKGEQHLADNKEQRADRECLLEVCKLTKLFGQLRANNAVNLRLNKGEIHALLGENGAGKSTFVKMLYGALEPDEGEIFWQGEKVAIDNPAIARSLGIGMVFQHFSLFDAMTVAENIALALPNTVSLKGLSEKISAVSNNYGLPLNPDDIVADLPVGIRQRIEIVRCLLQEPKLIIMDEPTSVLTPQEADKLFLTLERLTDEGCAVLYISHRLDEVRRICHHATVMRHGKVVSECDPSTQTAASLANMMVGADVGSVGQTRKRDASAPVRLSLNKLNVSAQTPFATQLKDICLQVHGGEVLAIAGVAGNGQSELFDVLSGETLVDPEMVSMYGENVGDRFITARRRLGAAFVPEERLGHATVPGMRLSDNIILTRHSTSDGLVSSGILKHAKSFEIEQKIKFAYDIRMSHQDPEARSLSGGNLQKFVMGREIDRDPEIFIVNQPTWGVDAGAATFIRQNLINLAAKGAAVLVISQDLDEIFEIAHRVAVISRGHLSEAEPVACINRETIGLLMAGQAESGTEAR